MAMPNYSQYAKTIIQTSGWQRTQDAQKCNFKLIGLLVSSRTAIFSMKWSVITASSQGRMLTVLYVGMIIDASDAKYNLGIALKVHL